MTALRLAPRHRWTAVAALALGALVAAAIVRDAASEPVNPLRVVVVVDASVSPDPALVARAGAALRRAERSGAVEGQLRVPRSPTEQLSVTHYFAVKRFDAVVGVGLDDRVAVAPVARRFPAVDFVAAAGDDVEGALRRAIGARRR
jgi:hypothetical protein